MILASLTDYHLNIGDWPTIHDSQRRGELTNNEYELLHDEPPKFEIDAADPPWRIE